MDRDPRFDRTADGRGSDGYLRAIVETSTDAIYRVDLDGRITGWSPAAERLFSYRATEVEGTPSAQLFADEHLDAYEVVIRQAVVGALTTHTHTDIRPRSGPSVPVALAVAAIHDEDRGVVGASVIVRDLTEQREALATLAASETRLRESEALAHVGGWVLDVGTGTVQWSEELHRMHGIDPVDFQGSLEGHLALVHPDDRAGLESAIAMAVDGHGVVDAEYRVVRPDGKLRWLYTRAERAFAAPSVAPGVPLPAHSDGTRAVIGLRGICQDVSERHDAEQAVRDAYERERAAAEGLRAADRLKDEFLATVSHELRTPLTAIMGFAQLIGTGIDRASLPDMVTRIQRNAVEMHGMVERVLDFSRLQAGNVDLRLQTINLHQLVAKTVEGYRAALDEHHIDVSLAEDDTEVLADVDATMHIIGNLLSNAVKFSPAREPITVSTARDRDAGRVTVVDRGPGIPAELKEAVFERFFQGPNQPPGRRGTGVGLAIVRRYAELQGGRAWCETPEGGGTAVMFTLPLARKGGR